jgi:hypothetical protein
MKKAVVSNIFFSRFQKDQASKYYRECGASELKHYSFIEWFVLALYIYIDFKIFL